MIELPEDWLQDVCKHKSIRQNVNLKTYQCGCGMKFVVYENRFVRDFRTPKKE